MDNQVRVKIFFPGYNSKNIKRNICRTYAVENFKYKHIFFVDDNTYTHAIIINYYDNKIIPKIKENIPKKNILGIAWEPPILLQITEEFKDYATKRIGKFLYGGNYNNLPKCFVGYYGFISHLPVKPKPKKTKFMSIIVSNKKQLEGHKYRHTLVQAILKTNLDIHIYGRGAKLYSGDRIKGKFYSKEPYIDYTFTIAVENKRYNHYISEKFSTAISLNCIPIYYGAQCIKNYFGDNCYIKLTGVINDDIKLLQGISNNKEKYLLNLDTARNHILNGNASLPVFLSKHWKG